MKYEEITHKGHKFEKIIDRDFIIEAAHRVMAAIKQRRSHTKALYISMLDGSVPFENDLKKIANWDMDIMQISYHSYQGGMKSTGKIKVDIPIDTARVKDRDVIIIEDIVDTGLTMAAVIEELKKAGAKSVKIVCMLDKVKKHPKLPILCAGYQIEDKFVIGYGMDFDGKFRDLKSIYVTGLKEDEELVIE